MSGTDFSVAESTLSAIFSVFLGTVSSVFSGEIRELLLSRPSSCLFGIEEILYVIF